MSIAFETLIEVPNGAVEKVAAQVAAALNLDVLEDVSDRDNVWLGSPQPIIVRSATYLDEPGLPLSRYNFTVMSWDAAQAERIYSEIAEATAWPIALFDEELYQITKQRGPLMVSA